MILHTFLYTTPREQFRPDIIGKIHGNNIDLEFTISAFLKRLFLIIIAMEFLFVVFIYTKFQQIF